MCSSGRSDFLACKEISTIPPAACTFPAQLRYTLAPMETAQLKKAGMVILGLGVLALAMYAAWSKEPTHMYIGIAATVIGLVMTAVGFLKK